MTERKKRGQPIFFFLREIEKLQLTSMHKWKHQPLTKWLSRPLWLRQNKSGGVSLRPQRTYIFPMLSLPPWTISFLSTFLLLETCWFWESYSDIISYSLGETSPSCIQAAGTDRLVFESRSVFCCPRQQVAWTLTLISFMTFENSINWTHLQDVYCVSWSLFMLSLQPTRLHAFQLPLST